MTSKDGRIMLLSCEDREDIVEFWLFVQRALWPECAWPIDVLSEPTVQCWARRLLAYIEVVQAEWLLWFIDDAVVQHPIDTERLDRCLRYFLEHPRVGLFVLSETLAESSGGDMSVPIEDLPGFHYLKRNRQAYKRHSAAMPQPAFWRREALLDVTRDAVENMTPVMDDGFAGLYSWELMAPHILYEKDWDIVIASNWRERPIRHINAVRQGWGWTDAALGVARQLGYTLNPERGYRRDQEGYSLPMRNWRERARPARKHKERIERGA